MGLNDTVQRGRLVRVAMTVDCAGCLRRREGSADERQSRDTVNVDASRRRP
jgi:hypothetical protein